MHLALIFVVLQTTFCRPFLFFALDFWHRFDCLDISWFSSSFLPSCFTFHSIRWVHFEKTYKSLKIFGIRVPNIFKSTRNKMQNHIPYFKHSSSSMITKILWLFMAFLSCKKKPLGLHRMKFYLCLYFEWKSGQKTFYL